jgi:hypothetical protein
LEVTKTVAGQLRERFEGKEAICVEKGLLWRVRVENIRAAMALYIEADLVRITSNSFETLRRQYGLQWAAPLLRGEPQRWGIGGGWQMTGSENSWHMGYGGWSLYFEPALVRAVEEQANRLPDNLDGDAHHRAILKIVEPAWFEQRDVFPFLAIAAVAAKSRTAQFQPFEQAQPIDAHECALESAVETIMNGRWRVYRTPVGNLLSILAPEEIRQAGGLAPEAVAGRLRYVSPGIAGWNFSPNLKFLEFLHQVIETSALTDPEFLEIARQHGRDTVFIKNGTDTDTYIGTFEISDGKPVPGSYRPCNRYCIMSQKDLAGLPTWVERAVVARLSGRH